MQEAIDALEQIIAGLLVHAAEVLAQDPEKAVQVLAFRSRAIDLQAQLKAHQAQK